MKCRSLVLLFPLLLAACQAENPYQASSLPLPPAPPAQQPAYDPAAYPAAPRDYGHYRSWAFANDHLPVGSTWASSEQIADALSSGLDQRGLRPAVQGAAPDLRIAADVHLETRIRQVQDGYTTGYYADPYRPGYGGYTNVPVVRTYQEQVVVVRIDVFDAASGQPIWSGTAESASGGDQAQRGAALRGAIQQALAGYPPA